MAVRNCREIGENLQKVVSRLMANDELVNLLYYTDKDPLSQPHLTDAQKSELIFDKLIRITPRLISPDTAQSVVIVRVTSGNQNIENDQFKDVEISIEVFVPFTQILYKSTNLRPFAILGAIQESLNNKTVNGLGKMIGGDFALEYITDEMIVYDQTFNIIIYD